MRPGCPQSTSVRSTPNRATVVLAALYSSSRNAPDSRSSGRLSRLQAPRACRWRPLLLVFSQLPDGRACSATASHQVPLRLTRAQSAVSEKGPVISGVGPSGRQRFRARHAARGRPRRPEPEQGPHGLVARRRSALPCCFSRTWMACVAVHDRAEELPHAMSSAMCRLDSSALCSSRPAGTSSTRRATASMASCMAASSDPSVGGPGSCLRIRTG